MTNEIKIFNDKNAIEKMRNAGKLAKDVLAYITEYIKDVV